MQGSRRWRPSSSAYARANCQQSREAALLCPPAPARPATTRFSRTSTVAGPNNRRIRPPNVFRCPRALDGFRPHCGSTRDHHEPAYGSGRRPCARERARCCSKPAQASAPEPAQALVDHVFARVNWDLQAHSEREGIATRSTDRQGSRRRRCDGSSGTRWRGRRGSPRHWCRRRLNNNTGSPRQFTVKVIG